MPGKQKQVHLHAARHRQWPGEGWSLSFELGLWPMSDFWITAHILQKGVAGKRRFVRSRIERSSI
jgi:hypothetical protein